MSKKKQTKDSSQEERIFNVEAYAKSLIDYRYNKYDEVHHKDSSCVSKCNGKAMTHGRVYNRNGVRNVC